MMLYASVFIVLGIPLQVELQIPTQRYVESVFDKSMIEDTHADMQDLGSLESPGFVTLSVNTNREPYNSIRGYPTNALNSDQYFRLIGENIGGKLLAGEVKRGNVIARRRYLTVPGYKTQISRYQMRKFPYSNIVRLSSGCTGTLLTPYHVITAAHCVHDGQMFKENAEMLKVYVPNKYGFRIHYIAKINVPVMWMRSRVIPEYAYDYAVLQLNLPVIGKDKFMQLALPTIKTKYTDLHFFGFFPDEVNTLWESTCLAENSVYVYGGNAVLTDCESASGNSGAAVFASDTVDDSKIIGVLSSTLPQPDNTDYEAIALLTLSKCLDICAMIYPEGEKYDVCIKVKRSEIQFLKVGSNRIMPFFG